MTLQAIYTMVVNMSSHKQGKIADFSEDQRGEIGERLRIARRRKGLLQSQAAEKMSYSINHYNKVEAGRVSFGRRLVALAARILAVREEWLLTGEEPMHDPQSESDVAESPGRYEVDNIRQIIAAAVRIMRDPQARETVRRMVEDMKIDEQNAWEAVILAAMRSKTCQNGDVSCQ